jgi:hypothetical protein
VTVVKGNTDRLHSRDWQYKMLTFRVCHLLMYRGPGWSHGKSASHWLEQVFFCLVHIQSSPRVQTAS